MLADSLHGLSGAKRPWHALTADDGLYGEALPSLFWFIARQWAPLTYLI